MKRTGDVEDKVLSEEAVPEFCLVFAEISLHVIKRRERKEVENIIRLFSDASSAGTAPRWHVKEIDGCKRIWNDTKNKELA